MRERTRSLARNKDGGPCGSQAGKKRRRVLQLPLVSRVGLIEETPWFLRGRFGGRTGGRDSVSSRQTSNATFASLSNQRTREKAPPSVSRPRVRRGGTITERSQPLERETMLEVVLLSLLLLFPSSLQSKILSPTHHGVLLCASSCARWASSLCSVSTS